MMKHPREWFSRLPLDDDGDNAHSWYQRSLDVGGGPETRCHLVAGDLSDVNEYENGDFSGAQFSVDVRLWENTGHFDYDNRDRWHDHSVCVVFWRWGVYLAWRGGRKAGR